MLRTGLNLKASMAAFAAANRAVAGSTGNGSSGNGTGNGSIGNGSTGNGSTGNPSIGNGAVSAGGSAAEERLWLVDIPLGVVVELVEMELPPWDAEALLERGVLPGCRLCPVRRSPFGDPIVDVEGTRLALRREMAGCLCVRRMSAEV